MLKQFILIIIIASIPPMFIYWLGIYAFDNYSAHLGYFGIFSVFSIHVFMWGLLGGIGFVISSALTKHSLKDRKLPFKCIAILGLLIGTSHFLVQLNIEKFLVMLPLAVFISWFYSAILYHFFAIQVKSIPNNKLERLS